MKYPARGLPPAKMAMPNNSSRFVFFGTPEFSATVLDGLLVAGMVPVAIVTNPDRPFGRKKVLTPPPVKLSTNHYPLITSVFQPEILDDAFIAELKKLNAIVGVLAAYGKIIPRAVFALFPKGIVVVHPSPLPKYRGATPIQSAILAGEKNTGTTLFIMDEKVDHGPTVGFAPVDIVKSDTYTTLAHKLAEASANLLITVLPRYINGEITLVAQDEQGATYTKKFSNEDGFVDLIKDAPEKIWRMVRAFTPEPGVWCVEGGRRKKILDAEIVDGALIVRKFQFEGELPRDG